MSQKFTRVPDDTFEKLQLNAGILVDAFTPATGVIGNILGATTGGIQFSTNPEFTDFGEDIDNVPNNMLELKHLNQFDPQMSGTFLTCTPALAKSLVGAADIDSGDATRVIPRAELLASDYDDVWWIGDYSDVNTGANAGFIAIHLMNALNTAGFQIQSTKNEKGQLAFEYHGHYSIAAQDTVPFEIYVKGNGGTLIPSVTLSKNYISIVKNTTYDLTANVIPAGTTVTWASADTTKASVSGGTVTAGSSAGNTIITASITQGGVTYNDTCTVVVTNS
nr:Ig-like domain-containing protein [Clostridia bacterium]